MLCNNAKICFICKKKDCWLTKYTKEEYNKAKEGLKRYIYQYLIDNDINDDFNKDIMAIVFNILTPTTVLTIISGNFFYNDYSIKYFIILNRLIPIKTVKNIVMSINNNAFIYGLTNSIKPGGIEPSTIRHSNISNKSSNNKSKSATYFYNNNNPPDVLEFVININLSKLVNIKNLTVNINFLNCYFNNDR